MATGLKVLYEFGPFQVDPDRQVLLRENQPVAITPKAFETLLILVRHSREVVSKDELMKAVWPDSFVEEANLSQNIFRIRKALGVAPGDERYIVTLPGRGYRFAAQVREVVLDGEDLIIGARSLKPMVVEQTDLVPNEIPDRFPNTSLDTLLAGPSRESIWKYTTLIAAVVAALVVVAIVFISRHPQKPIALSETDSVLLADFTNSTGDPVFDGILRQGLSVQLEQSPLLSLVSDDRIQHTLRLMGEPPDARLTPEIARQICERNASAAVLEGSIAKMGSQYVLGLRAKSCRTGEVLAEEQAQAVTKEGVLTALSQIASRFRTRIGESLSTVEKHDTPLAEATTPSLEALKSYSAGLNVEASMGTAAAIPFFKRAIEIDPEFATAYAALGLMYGDRGESDLAAETTRKAYELRVRASDNEKFFITAYYDGRVTGNQEKAQQTCEAWAQTYPREIVPHAFLSAFIYGVLGKKEKAVEEGEKAIQLGPDFAIGYDLLAEDYEHLNRFGEAEIILERASERNLEIPDYIVKRYDIAFLKGDKAGMEREVALAQRESGAEDWMADHEAFALAYTGHMKDARRMSRHAADLAQQAAHQERAALFETGAALWEALFGNASAARHRAMAVRELANDREVEYGAAFALALSGDSFQAQTLANDLERRFPEDTSVRFSYLPTIRALLMLNHGEPAKAIELLQIAAPHELSTPRSKLQGLFGALYPVYVRGQAYLAEHQGAQAAAEFQKILDQPGTVVSDPIGALAHLGLARASILQRDTVRARSAYQDFLTLWKDADPDIPVLKEAKAEYANLK